MADFSLAVLADSAIVARDGKLSVIGIFRNITLRKIPAVFPKFSVVAIISQLDKPIKIKIEVMDLKENVVIAKLPEGNLVPPKMGEDVQMVVDLVNVPFKTEGQHEVRISIDGEIAKFIPFKVHLAKTQEETKPSQ